MFSIEIMLIENILRICASAAAGGGCIIVGKNRCYMQKHGK